MLALLLAGFTALQAQSTPIYLDPRAGEDRSLIDVSEFVDNYPRAVLREYDQALEDARRGNADTATARLESVIKTTPDFYAAHQNLGVLYQKQGRYRDAERQFRTAQTLNPRSAAPLVNLGALFVEESNAGSGQIGIADRAILNDALGVLQEALKLQPSSPFAHYLTGVVYYQTSFYEAAEDHFHRALGGGSNMRFVRLAIANVHIQLEEWDSVVVELDAYLRENPFARNRDEVRSVRAQAAKMLDAHPE
jgi:tetratricopeptide (TPR) repeat protein